MDDLSIHPGRAKFGRNYDPSRRTDGEAITKTAKNRTKGKLGKKVRRLEIRIRSFQSMSEAAKQTMTLPGSMK